jgi:hypothetical protein
VDKIFARFMKHPGAIGGQDDLRRFIARRLNVEQRRYGRRYFHGDDIDAFLKILDDEARSAGFRAELDTGGLSKLFDEFEAIPENHACPLCGHNPDEPVERGCADHEPSGIVLSETVPGDHGQDAPDDQARGRTEGGSPSARVDPGVRPDDVQPPTGGSGGDGEEGSGQPGETPGEGDAPEEGPHPGGESPTAPDINTDRHHEGDADLAQGDERGGDGAPDPRGRGTILVTPGTEVDIDYIRRRLAEALQVPYESLNPDQIISRPNALNPGELHVLYTGSSYPRADAARGVSADLFWTDLPTPEVTILDDILAEDENNAVVTRNAQRGPEANLDEPPIDRLYEYVARLWGNLTSPSRS